jgi:RND family efflux transporter MFP subunit
MRALFQHRSTWLAAGALLLLLAGGLIVSNQAKAKRAEAAAAAGAAAAPSPYSAVASGKADVEGGMIQVAARRAGIVKEVYVNEGDSVVRGQILARQEDDEPRLAVERAAAALQEARAQIKLSQVQLASARREHARLQALTATNFVAGQRVDQAADKVRETEATLEALRAAVATAQASLGQAQYNLEQTVIRAPTDGRIARRYANPGAGASTLNVSTMFDLEPATARIVRAEIAEGALAAVAIGQPVQMSPESDPSKVYRGAVLRRAAVFGARKLQSDDPTERTDDRVVEVVVSADDAPFLIGQRVLVKFMRPGATARS